MSSRKIPFIRSSGCGNVFLLVAAEVVPDIAERKQLTIKMCDDGSMGGAADGVEWFSSGGGEADVVAELINSDGSEAEVSGNGTRCVAAHWIAEHGGERVRVLTGAGVRDCQLVFRKDNDFEFEMKMGAPEIEGQKELLLASGKVTGTKLSMGNPQFVVFVDDFNFPWQIQGEEIQAQPCFPSGTNVDFARVISSSELECRFFERGAGETLSSGTGSCASAVAAISSGHAKSPVRVYAVGGTQTVRWEREVFLRGSARLINAGEYSREK